MATHSSLLAWEIPLSEEAGGLWYIGLQLSTCHNKGFKSQLPYLHTHVHNSVLHSRQKVDTSAY